jgi:hypothetical protein
VLVLLMLLMLLLLLLHPILQFSGPHGRAAMVERREHLGLAILAAAWPAWPAWAAAQGREA